MGQLSGTPTLKRILEKMGNPPHQAGLSILRSWPNDRNVGRTRIALIGGTREGKSPMLDVQNLQRPDPNHPQLTTSFH